MRFRPRPCSGGRGHGRGRFRDVRDEPTVGQGGLEVFAWVVDFFPALGVLHEDLGLIRRFLAGLLALGPERFSVLRDFCAINRNIRMLTNGGRGYRNVRHLLLKVSRMAFNQDRICRFSERSRKPPRMPPLANSCGEPFFVTLLQIPAPRLLPFDRFEKRLKVALPKAAAAFALNHFIEDCRPILHRTCEDLQHVALIVAVH